LSEASLNFIRMPCWGLPLTNYRLLWGMLYIVINLTNKARNITIYLQWLLPRYAITLAMADSQIEVRANIVWHWVEEYIIFSSKYPAPIHKVVDSHILFLTIQRHGYLHWKLELWMKKYWMLLPTD
jgi:hypothetical protein